MGQSLQQSGHDSEVTEELQLWDLDLPSWRKTDHL